jgi:hypothetical protein
VVHQDLSKNFDNLQLNHMGNAKNRNDSRSGHSDSECDIGHDTVLPC